MTLLSLLPLLTTAGVIIEVKLTDQQPLRYSSMQG